MSSPDMLNDLVLADGVAVIVFQFAEDNGGEDGQAAQDEERLVDTVNHFRRARVKAVGNEERRGQRRRRHAETDRHLLHRARAGTRAAGLFLAEIGMRAPIWRTPVPW